MRIEVVFAWPRQAETRAVELAEGANVADALAAAGMEARAEASGYAIFGRAATLATPLMEGDRVELLRPLQADPKEARRKRAGRRSGDD